MRQKKKRWWQRFAMMGSPQDMAQKQFVGASQSFMYQPGSPVWSSRNYQKFAEEGYIRNVVVHRAVEMIASAAAHVPFVLFDKATGDKVERHPLMDVLNRPNPFQGGTAFFHSVYASRLISGNAYLQAVAASGKPAKELYMLRPDRVAVIAGKNGLPAAFRYGVGEKYRDYPVDAATGKSAILHIKSFHPLNDWYGLSPIEAAAYSIDQHNQAGAWNQALLQNGARPSGALVVKAGDGGTGHLSQHQYERLKNQLDAEFSGAENAGRPLLLEGGLDWREMSLSPKEMDFIEAKHSAARDIALALGIPPQMLGIPGDNTYSNLVEARLSFWEQTVLPLVDTLTDALNLWLVPAFGEQWELRFDVECIEALSTRREQVWDRVNRATFLTDEEKRRLVGL